MNTFETVYALYEHISLGFVFSLNMEEHAHTHAQNKSMWQKQMIEQFTSLLWTHTVWNHWVGDKQCLLLWLIFLFLTGKILSDDTPLKEYKIDEKNFVVVMVTKVRE